MSEPGWAGWLAEHREQETASERAWRQARQAEQRDNRAAELEQAERAAALQERHELLQVAAVHAGLAGRSAADVFADAGRQGDEDALYSEAQRTIERIDRRRARRQQEMAERAQQMAEVTGLASRSATGDADLLSEAKQLHRQFVATTRAMQAEAATATPRQERRPFASRGAGQAIRSESCIHCISQGASDEESWLLHSDPELNVPVTPPGQAAQPVQAERHVPMIYR
jgi:hypothetical protein